MSSGGDPHVTVDAEAIPDELQDRDQWLLWDASADSPRRPHWRGDFSVSWTDPDDWHSFGEAIEAARSTETWGVGYVFSADNDDHARGLYGAIDIDGCVDEDGHPKDWLPSLSPFLKRDAYMEYSPSGRGVHIPIVGFEPPEWWSDSHLSADEHEGVEAYGKKFFTVTGDALDHAGGSVIDDGEYVEDWLIEAHKALTGEDPTKTESESFDDAESGGRSGREEFLDEDAVRDALDHISPDVPYDTWRDIGFALADFFSSDRRRTGCSRTGRALAVSGTARPSGSQSGLSTTHSQAAGGRSGRSSTTLARGGGRCRRRSRRRRRRPAMTTRAAETARLANSAVVRF